MTDAELAKRAVAVRKHWHWMPGMRTTGGTLACETTPSEVYLYRFGWAPASELLPDLDDPATKGCLLHLVREAHGNSGLYVERVDAGWCVPLGGRERGGPTEAEALVAALEAAP